MRGKQTWDEVEVFGGVGVDVLAERVGDIFIAVFLILSRALCGETEWRK